MSARRKRPRKSTRAKRRRPQAPRPGDLVVVTWTTKVAPYVRIDYGPA